MPLGWLNTWREGEAEAGLGSCGAGAGLKTAWADPAGGPGAIAALQRCPSWDT